MAGHSVHPRSAMGLLHSFSHQYPAQLDRPDRKAPQVRQGHWDLWVLLEHPLTFPLSMHCSKQ